MRVVDLFAGLGGMACGAIEAGAEVVLAVDSDPTPLKVLGANAPQTTTVVATLGEGRNEVSLLRLRRIFMCTCRLLAPNYSPMRAGAPTPTQPVDSR